MIQEGALKPIFQCDQEVKGFKITFAVCKGRTITFPGGVEVLWQKIHPHHEDEKKNAPVPCEGEKNSSLSPGEHFF